MPSDSVIRGRLANPSNTETASRLLQQARLEFQACPTIDALIAPGAEGVGALLIEEEGLTARELEALNGFLSRQPPWSDLPVILLVKRIKSDDSPRHWSQWPLSLTVVTQPVSSVDLVSILRIALRERQRQHEVRDLLANLQELNRTLEQRVAERTAQLERSNRDLEQFAYVASHDLQAPLRHVTGFMKLLSERYKGKLDAKADQYIDLAVQGATQMSDLITDLLAYSKVGNQDLELQSINLRQPLDRALSLLDTSIVESGARIAVAELPLVRIHSAQMAQVFQNLIGNAIKFRGERPVEIEVGARPEGGPWLVWVKDNGIGMDPGQSPQAFELFRRLHDRGKYPGTGIGLAICKKIVERHGGRIRVESQPDQGSTFYFTLPAEGMQKHETS